MTLNYISLVVINASKQNQTWLLVSITLYSLIVNNVSRIVQVFFKIYFEMHFLYNTYKIMVFILNSTIMVYIFGIYGI